MNSTITRLNFCKWKYKEKDCKVYVLNKKKKTILTTTNFLLF